MAILPPNCAVGKGVEATAFTLHAFAHAHSDVGVHSPRVGTALHYSAGESGKQSRAFAHPTAADTSTPESPHMITSVAAKRLLAGFESYLAGIFHPLPEERVVTGAIQSVYNWFFPFLRNAFICGVLQYLADASGSVMLQALAIVAYVALAAYCLSYVNMWVLTPFHFVKHKRLAFFLDALVTLAVLLSLGYAVLAGTRFAIDEIAKGHAASRSSAARTPAVPSPTP
jgi:hypothetical protein